MYELTYINGRAEQKFDSMVTAVTVGLSYSTTFFVWRFDSGKRILVLHYDWHGIKG